MSSTTVFAGSTAKSGAPAVGNAANSNLRRWLINGALVLASLVAAAFFGINDYSSGSSTLISQAQRNSQRFETFYRDAAETKIATLRLGVDLILANPDIIGAFARDDRAGLAAKAVPLFTDVLKPRYALTQLNFWTPPAKLYLRSVDPKEFGTDGSNARRSIVTAIERRAVVTGMEAGIGGLLGIRAIAPVYDGTRLVGVVELGDDVFALLTRARETTGVEFSSGLDRKRSDEVERKSDAKVDAIQGSDVFYRYSSDQTSRIMHDIKFDSRSGKGQLVQQNGRTVYVKPFIINNFASVPTVVVANLFDLTDDFASTRQSALIKAIVLFAILALASCLGFMQFGKIQQGFTRVVFGERKKLEETTAALEAAKAKLKDLDLIKQGFFTNLVAAVTEPLQAVAGQLQTSIPAVEAALKTPSGVDANLRASLCSRLGFALNETNRLSRFITDYRQIELFRQRLVKSPAATAQLATVVSDVLENELSSFKRLPQLIITTSIPTDLPPARANDNLLRWSIAGLVSYAAQGAGVGSIAINGSVDAARWLRLSITGTAYAAAGAPTDALLEDSRQFIARLSSPERDTDATGTMMALVLSRMIAEYYGGRIEVAKDDGGQPGFVIFLPAAT